jgi:hypothetical protein
MYIGQEKKKMKENGFLMAEVLDNSLWSDPKKFTQ